MYCHVCGQQNPDNAANCHKCGTAFTSAQAPQMPHTFGGPVPPINNYLIPAIFATLCCCLPFGIVSIVYAAQVNAKLSSGDVLGAQQAADNAKMWFWIAFGIGLVVVGIQLVFMLLGAVANM